MRKSKAEGFMIRSAKRVFAFFEVGCISVLLSGCGIFSSSTVIDTEKIGVLPVEKNTFDDKELERLIVAYRNETSNASGSVLKMTEISVALDNHLAVWEKCNLGRLGNDVAQVRKIREYLQEDCKKYKQIKEISYLIDKIKNTSNFNEYEKASKELMEMCTQQRKSSIWTSTEQLRFQDKYREIEERLSEEKCIYDEIVSDLRKELSGVQKIFVSKCALDDYTNAKDVYRREKNKWFNWYLLGYPRDNREVIINSALVCDRIIKADKVDYQLRSDASTLKGNLLDRLNMSAMKKYESKPALPAYEKISKYPSGKDIEIELLFMANKTWKEKRDGKLKTYNAELGTSMKGNLK